LLDIPVTRHRLDNGLRVVISRDTTAPIVGVNLWYGVGSRNERPGRTGFAHLFEHMMFQGSANVPKGAHFQLVERAGGSLNASTWFDRTNYFETLPAHHLELALWLESDRMGWFESSITPEKLNQDAGRNAIDRWRRRANDPRSETSNSNRNPVASTTAPPRGTDTRVPAIALVPVVPAPPPPITSPPASDVLLVLTILLIHCISLNERAILIFIWRIFDQPTCRRVWEFIQIL
jgi:hypothetical protein